MFYRTDVRDHGLPHDPFKALIAPRPIGWISTISKDGICNLAPYSFFNAVASNPPYVMFASAGIKDSARNARDTGAFVCSLATWDLREHMNVSSAPVPPGVDEFPIAGLTAVKSTAVAPPRVGQSPASFECEYWQTVEIPGDDGATADYVVFGKVVGVYIDENFIKDGRVDTGAMQPIARMGYMDYAVVRPDTTFTLNRPKVDEDGNVTSPEAKAWDGTYR